ncbi:MAG: NTP transferase domain-containing protein, partial [Desulfovibrionaceae bacterium]
MSAAPGLRDVAERPVFAPGPHARECWAVLLAAGSGSRLAGALGGARKQYVTWRGAPLYWSSARTFARCAGVDGLVFVFPPEDAAAQAEAVARLDRARSLGLPWRTC